MMDFKEGEVLYFDKPLGWTSFKVVGHVRYHLCRHLGVKKLKVGHAGTPVSHQGICGHLTAGGYDSQL